MSKIFRENDVWKNGTSVFEDETKKSQPFKTLNYANVLLRF